MVEEVYRGVKAVKSSQQDIVNCVFRHLRQAKREGASITTDYIAEVLNDSDFEMIQTKTDLWQNARRIKKALRE